MAETRCSSAKAQTHPPFQQILPNPDRYSQLCPRQLPPHFAKHKQKASPPHQFHLSLSLPIPLFLFLFLSISWHSHLKAPNNRTHTQLSRTTKLPAVAKNFMAAPYPKHAKYNARNPQLGREIRASSYTHSKLSPQVRNRSSVRFL